MVVNRIILAVLAAASSDLISIRHSHLFLSDICYHITLYRNKESLMLDLKLLYRAMIGIIKHEVIACNLSGILDVLLSSLQFWFIPVQVMKHRMELFAFVPYINNT